MKHWKQKLSGLIAAVMLFSMLPATVLAENTDSTTSTAPELGPMVTTDQSPAFKLTDFRLEAQETGKVVKGEEYDIAYYNLGHLETKLVNIDLEGYTPSELKKVKLYYQIQTGAPDVDTSKVYVSWRQLYSDLTPRDDDYTVIKSADGGVTFDLTQIYAGGGEQYVELLVGRDATDSGAIRYIITFQFTPFYMPNFLEWTVYNEKKDEVAKHSLYGSNNWRETPLNKLGNCGFFNARVDYGEWKTGETAYLALSFDDIWKDSGLEAKVYEGYYKTANEAERRGKEITKMLWDKGNESTYSRADFGSEAAQESIVVPEFTVVLFRDEEAVDIVQFGLYLSASTMSLSIPETIYADSEGGRTRASYAHPKDENGNTNSNGYIMLDGYPANGAYYVSFSISNPYADTAGGEKGREWVEVAYADKYDTIEDAKEDNANNIKRELFSNDGYLTDFGKGKQVTFTVFDIEGYRHQVTLTTQDNEEVNINFAKLYFKDKNETEITPWYRNAIGNSRTELTYFMSGQYEPGAKYLIRMSASYSTGTTAYSSVVDSAFVGYHTTKARAQAAKAQEIPVEQLFPVDIGTPATGFEWDFSKPLQITIFDKYSTDHHFTIQTDKELGIGYELLDADGTQVANYAYWDSQLKTAIYRMISTENKVEGKEYYLRASVYSSDRDAVQLDVSVIECAVEGTASTLTESVRKNDIKTDLFGDGYPGDYSTARTFTVFTKYGQVTSFKFQVLNALEDAPEVEPGGDPEVLPTESLDSYPRTYDTYFNIEGANDAEGNPYPSYVLPFADDSYNFNGYQTVFLLNEDGSPVTGTIYPTFLVNDSVSIFAGQNIKGGGAGKQESGKQGYSDYGPTSPIQYSAAAEDRIHLKNYWVTFVTKQTGGASLFINGITNQDESHKTNGMYTREVYLTYEYDYHHDIYLANIGDKELTGLYVRLEGARNVALDEYWTVYGDGTRSLKAFDSIAEDPQGYGTLDNVTKIRLVRPENGYGDISGTLVIGSANSGEEYRINLTGTAGKPQIATKELVYGVLFVPYDVLVQTNDMYRTNNISRAQAVAFEEVVDYILDENGDRIWDTEIGWWKHKNFALHDVGLELTTNGEIYGTPLRWGTLPVTVRVGYSNHSRSKTVNGHTYTEPVFVDSNETDTARFTLEILENTDENVWKYDEKAAEIMGYKIDDYDVTYAIPNENGTASNIYGNETAGYDDTAIEGLIGDNSWDNSTMEFWSTGAYQYFEEVATASEVADTGSLHVLIDGKELTPSWDPQDPQYGDYSHKEGSTRITLNTQSLAQLNGGTHTLAVEFRESDTRVVRRAAQNFTITSKQNITKNDRYYPTPAGGDNDKPSSNPGSGSYGGSSAGITKYDIKIVQTTGGQVSVDRSSAAAGETVTITVNLDYIYKLESLSVVDANGNSVELNKISDDKYTFRMPSSAVTITPSFVEELPEHDPNSELPFYDVRTDHWFYPYILFAYENGLMVGISDQLFAPNSEISRAMIVLVLYRLDGSPSVSNSSFSDVPQDQWYSDAISWAKENHIVNGYGDGRFGPNDPSTREQMVTILMSYAKYKGIDTSKVDDLSLFPDHDSVSDWAATALTWAIAEEIIIGKDGLLDPLSGATRAEFATILSRFCNTIEKNTQVEKDTQE